MVMHLRDLLSIAHDFDNHYKTLSPYMDDLQSHLNQSYDEEIKRADLLNSNS